MNKMNFNFIDMETWDRKECFTHFMTIAKSTYSITVNIDITDLKKYTEERHYRLYPTMTWIVAKAVNNHREFRMAVNEKGQLGYYDVIYPDYSVLNDKTKIMDSLCTPFTENFERFHANMVSDMKNYHERNIYTEKVPNFFVASCVPWLNYTSFSCMNEGDQPFLFPMVTWGKYEKKDRKITLPLTLQIHHAVADGYHCSLFFRDVEEILADFANYIEKDAKI